MVKFNFSGGIWFVRIDDDVFFGVINKSGFCISDISVSDLVCLSSDELRQIASKVDEVNGKKSAEHNVVRTEDEAHRPKLVCHSSSCRGDSIEMKPGMNVEDWAEAREKFLIQHPCSRIRR